MKFGLIIALIVLWLFSTMSKVNDKANSPAAIVVKSIFFWAAICIAYSLGRL